MGRLPTTECTYVPSLLDCPPAFSCRCRLVLVAPLAFAFQSPSVLVRFFGLSLPFLALVPVLLSVSLRPRLLLLVYCPGHSIPGPLRPRMIQCECVASLDVPVCGTGCTPGRSSPGAWALLLSAPDAPIRGVFLLYSLRCFGRSSPWHRVHPRRIQSGASGRASFCPGCSNPGRLFVVFSPLPRTLQSVAPGSPPDDPVRGLVPCFVPPRMLPSGASFYRFLSVASDSSP